MGSLRSTHRHGVRRGIALAAAVLFGLSACGGQSSEDAASQAATPGAAGVQVGHVHGLDVDPADGAIYMGTHFGLFRLGPGDTAQRVGEHARDIMGFTITGPKTFLGSGHPTMKEMAEGAPAHLGLIRSTDAGNTWTTVSEGGKADFHALQPAGDVLYAYDSQTGTVRRSDDEGRTWKSGARLEVIDLAAGPERPDRVYATTPSGVQISDDGGATFTALGGTPLLSHLDQAGANLIGIGADGRVYVRQGAGGGWQSPGKVTAGEVAAFTAVDQRRLLVATTAGAVLESRDGGRAFTVVFRTAGH